MIEWIRLSRLTITNDTGPMHVAAALSVRSSRFLGRPTRGTPARTANWTTSSKTPGCPVCRASRVVAPIPNPLACLHAITPRAFAAKARQALGQAPGADPLRMKILTCGGQRDKLTASRLATGPMTTTNDGSPEANSAGMTDADVLVPIKDFQIASGWASPASAGARARQCCEQLEEGRILFFDRIPFVFFKEDREFLLSQRQSGSGLHKNISYRPRENVLRGAAGNAREHAQMLEIMGRYSTEVMRFMERLLEPYASQLALDYASFRPEEESGRELPAHKRNDLLHVDAFPDPADERPPHSALLHQYKHHERSGVEHNRGLCRAGGAPR